MIKLKTYKVVLFLSCVFLVSTICFQSIVVVNANAIIPQIVPTEKGYIKSNGEICPSTLPIQRSGNTFFLTGNILNYSLEIQKNDIVFDGRGFTMSLPSSVSVSYWKPEFTAAPLIQITNASNIIITNVTACHFFVAISFVNCSNIQVMSCNLAGGLQAITAYRNIDCLIIGNQLNDNFDTALTMRDSVNLLLAYNNFSNNYCNGGRFYSLNNSQVLFNNFQNSSGAAVDLLSHNCNNRFFNNNFIDNQVGLMYSGDPELAWSENNTVINNFWSNLWKDIVNNSADAASGIDQAPLSQKNDVAFEPSKYLIPENNNAGFFDQFNSFLIIAVSLCVIIGLFSVFFILKKFCKN